jgi:hypothetical protein
METSDMAAKTLRCFQCRGPVGDWEAVVVNFGKRSASAHTLRYGPSAIGGKW